MDTSLTPTRTRKNSYTNNLNPRINAQFIFSACEGEGLSEA